MQDQDQDSKTESPTPRRREQFRKRGEVAFSREVMAVSGILAAILSLSVLTTFVLEEFGVIWAEVADRIAHKRGAIDSQLFELLMHQFAKILAVPASVGLIAALLTGVGMTRFNLSLEPLTPKWEKLNPLPKLKKMFFSTQTIVELLKGVAKLSVLTMIAWMMISKELHWLIRLPHMALPWALSWFQEALVRLVFAMVVALIILAALDYAWQWYQLEKKMRMSKQDIKDEVKQNEGDPLVQGQRRARQRQMAMQRASVPNTAEATVVVVNPTHVAVALRYNPGQDAAPLVLSKGVDQVAAQIRAVAREHGVPIIQRRSLARLMYKTCRIGKPIPIEVYEAVAEVLAIVMRQKRRQRR
ncbi:MAG: EscU/YscU/HrcU family type III secretion system export apparatus switch protein [Myxococcota bacterium]